jgi:hypothetical protein
MVLKTHTASKLFVYAVTQLENDTLLMQERVHKFK